MSVRALVIIVAVTLALAGVAEAQGPQKYIVSFLPGTSQAQRADSVRAAGAGLRFNYSIVDAAAITVGNPNALTALRQNPVVAGIVPDRPIQAFQQPTAGPNGIQPNAKPGSGGGGGGTSGQVVPEGVKRVGVPVAGSDGTGVGIAIVDTGIDAGNTDLAHPSRSFSAFANSGGIDITCDDNNSHGTHVAGIAAALNNTTGVVGVAPNATPYCVKVLDYSGSGSDGDVIAGLNWVSTSNADPNFAPKIRVVNMSLGRDRFPEDDLPNDPLHTAVKNLYDSGVVVVVAAGNDASKEVKDMIPAGYPEVFSVSSTTAVGGAGRCGPLRGISADTASFFTTDGRFLGGVGVTIAAPGEDSEPLTGCFISSVGILSTAVGGGTTRKSGTSMSTPHVTGVVARWIQKFGVPATGNDIENIRTNIRINAQGRGTAPRDSPTATYTYDGEREGVVQAP